MCFLSFKCLWFWVLCGRFYTQIYYNRFNFFLKALRETNIITISVCFQPWGHFGSPWGLQGAKKDAPGRFEAPFWWGSFSNVRFLDKKGGPWDPQGSQNGTKIAPKSIQISFQNPLAFLSCFWTIWGSISVPKMETILSLFRDLRRKVGNLWTCWFCYYLQRFSNVLRVQGLEISRKMSPETPLEWDVFLIDFWDHFWPILGAILDHFGSQNPPKMMAKSHMSKERIFMWLCGLNGGVGGKGRWGSRDLDCPQLARFPLTIDYFPLVSVTNGP